MAKRYEQPDPIHQLLDGLAKGVWWLITLSFGGNKSSQREEERVKTEFRSAFAALGSDLHDQAHIRQAIMRADILLDKALQYRRISGMTVGERLKAADRMINRESLDAAWRAHKVRNQLAHELDYKVNEPQARQVIADFRTILKALGVL